MEEKEKVIVRNAGKPSATASMNARILLVKIMASDIRAAFLQFTIQKASVPLSTRAENTGQAVQEDAG